MPIRIVLRGVTTHRDGKKVRPVIGRPFDFTQEELDSLATKPGSPWTRVPVQEMIADSPEPAAETGKSARPAATKAAPKTAETATADDL